MTLYNPHTESPRALPVTSKKNFLRHKLSFQRLSRSRSPTLYFLAIHAKPRVTPHKPLAPPAFPAGCQMEFCILSPVTITLQGLID